MTTLHIFIYILCPLIHIFTSFSFLEHNSIMILGRIVEQVNKECCIQEDNAAYPCVLIMSLDPYSSFIFVSGA